MRDHFSRDSSGKNIPSPVIAYYGAGRAWLSSRARGSTGLKPGGPARRWEAFYDCFVERIRLNDLRIWFQREAIASANRAGRWRPGYEVVKRAIVRCVPGADDLWYDGDRQEIVLSIEGQAQPFTNLSAGQRMMVALVADVASKAVMQRIAEGLTPDLQRRARALMELVGLDRHIQDAGGQPAKRDQRWMDREEAWATADSGAVSRVWAERMKYAAR